MRTWVLNPLRWPFKKKKLKSLCSNTFYENYNVLKMSRSSQDEFIVGSYLKNPKKRQLFF